MNDWEYRRLFAKVKVIDFMAYVTIDGWCIDKWYPTSTTEEEFNTECEEYFESARYARLREKRLFGG